jgi:peptidoglycan/LPS O-acetylase OafA/YrhL
MGVLRLFLAFSVMLGHTRGHGLLGLSFLNAAVAVQSFFIISGFYMALVLNEKYNKPHEYFLFLQQRFLRLYPTYLILISFVVVIDLAVYMITGQPWGSLANWFQYAHVLSPLKIAYLVVENIIIFGQEVVMMIFVNPATGDFSFIQGPGKPISAAYFLMIASSWSLAVEFCFYVIAPFLVRRTVRAQLVILAACFAVRAACWYFIKNDADHWIYFMFAPNLYFFMAGSIGYIIYKNYGATLKSVATSKPWLFLPFVVLGLDYGRFPDFRDLYLLWLPMLFLAVPTLFALFSRSRIDRLIGELSYPCYLIHPHVLMVTLPIFHNPRLGAYLGPVSFVATLILCILFYRFIESKTERFRESLYRKKHPKDYIQPPESRAAETPASSLN